MENTDDLPETPMTLEEFEARLRASNEAKLREVELLRRKNEQLRQLVAEKEAYVLELEALADEAEARRALFHEKEAQIVAMK